MDHSITVPSQTSAPSWQGRLQRLAIGAGTLPGVWTFLCCTAVFVRACWLPIIPNDFWWHARAGQWIVEHRSIPTVDLFTYTAVGEPWAYQSWLTEVGLYGLMRLGGPALALIILSLLSQAAYVVALLVAFRRTGGRVREAAWATSLAILLAHSNLSARPQAISLPLFALALWLADETFGPCTAHSRRLRWLWLPLFALWANVHGGFIFGLALVGSEALGALIEWRRGQRPVPREALAAGAMSALGVFATPLGTGIVGYVLGFVGHPITRILNAEFRSPTIRDSTGMALAIGIACLAVVLAKSGYRPRTGEAIRLLALLGLGLFAMRAVIWFGLALAPTMASGLAALAERCGPPRPVRRSSLAYVLSGSLIALSALGLPPVRAELAPLGLDWPLFDETTPVQAVEALRAIPGPLRVFHGQAQGSYMIWASPDVPVFIDTRIELYEPEMWYNYLAVSTARYDWEQILNRYDVSTLLVDKIDQEHLARACMSSRHWRLVYEDQRFAVVAREF